MKTSASSKQLRRPCLACLETNRAFTLTDLLVVIAMVAILLVVEGRALALNNMGKSKAMQCLENVRQISMGTTLFTEENRYYPPLYRMANASGWPAWTFTPTNFVVQNAAALFWPDALRLEGYVKDSSIFSCPALAWPAIKSIGGGSSTNYALGIGMNYPEIATIVSHSFATLYKPGDVKNPSQFVIFGDSGSVTTASRSLGADDWVPDTGYDAVLNTYYGGGSTYFRSPSDLSGFSSGDARMLPRHNRRVVAGWADGHVSLTKNSQIGWQYGGTDSRALWSRTHN